MSKIIITQSQLEKMVKFLNENHDDGSYMEDKMLLYYHTEST